MDSASTAVNNLLSAAGIKSAPVPGQREGEQKSFADGAQSHASGSTPSASASNTDQSGSLDGKQQELTHDSKKTGVTDTTVDQEIAPAVEHEKITREHEDREQTVLEKERHKDHYHTTIQPLKDREVQSTEHEHVQRPTEYREINKDDGAGKQEAAAARSGFENTVEEGKQLNKMTQEGTVGGENVHHHLHETIQPVIEKETIVPSVTHVTKPVHEKIYEGSENHGVTTEKPISVDEFKGELDGESTSFKESHDGKPDVPQ
ncbi:hypothetical protein Tdes44962_MAKER07283 [Teratosphaeria destructans]|uniref:Allergen n=1 Tax=Teratosphaeria destructans TaxID=418781 RepID=A0A9W7T052_9PEZI|nr:hypothetical protein Tdes44962_MAKER07283 [Teratosphaeria destructans]